MRIIFSFVNYQVRLLVRFFKQKSLARSITALLFLFVFLGVAAVIYGFTKSGFILINNDRFLREAMSLYLFELFLLIITYFIVISALIGGVFTMFKGQDEAWIIVTPGFKYFPFWHFLKIFVSSLWPLLFIALPGLLALASVFEVRGSAFILSLVALVLLVLFVVSATLVVIFVTARLLVWKTSSARFVTRKLVGILGLLIGILTLIVWSQSIPQDLFELLGVSDFNALTADIAPIFNRFHLLPSHQVAVILYSVQKGNLQALLFPLMILFCLAFSSSLLFWELSSWHLPLWHVFQEGGFEARVASAQVRPSPVAFPRYFQGSLGALFEKEAVVIFRSLKHLVWLGFLFSLWIILTSLNQTVKISLEKYHLKSTILPDIVFALQIVVLVYFISAFVLRFVFPSFSTERKTAWILGVAPIEMKRVFLAKFLFFTAIFTLLALIISFFNSTILGLAQAKAGIFIVLTLLLTIFVVTLGLTLGAIFPNFETDDPEVLSTSLPGLGFVLGSLVYGGLGAGAYYLYLSQGLGLILVLFGFITVALIGLMVMITPKFLKTIEFIKVRG